MTKQTNKKEKRKVTPETITKSVSRTLTSPWTFSCELQASECIALDVNRKCRDVNEKCREVRRDVNRKCRDANEKCRDVHRKCRDVNKKVVMSIKSVVM